MRQVARHAAAVVGLVVAGCHATPGGNPETQSPSASVPTASVAELIADDRWVGQRVRVTGTCIGYSRVLAEGPQPRTRSDWQLAHGDVAIWVVGAYPEGCSGSTPASEPATYEMDVATDTLPALGGQAASARRYLVNSGSR